MPRRFTSKQYWVLGLLAALTAGIIYLSFYLVGQLQEGNWWVNHSLHVQKEAASALERLLECESSCRGYLITGDPRFLEHYRQSNKGVTEHLTTLQTLTLDNPKEQEVVTRLFTAAQKKLRFCQTVIRSRQQDLHLPGHITISLYPGKVLMDEFSSAMAVVLAEEARILARRQQNAAQLEHNAYLGVALLAACMVAALCWIARSTRAYAYEQHSAKNEIAAARDEAIQARDAAVKANTLKSQFVANVSHEVRTPMAGILGLVELLKEDSTLPPQAREETERIHAAAHDLLAVLNDLLDFSQLEADKVELLSEPFTITNVLDQVLAQISPQAKQKGLALALNFDEDVPDRVIGDSKKVQAVLLNLAHNAVKFSPSGEVGLSVSLAGVQDKNATIKFTVTDNGIGISNDAQASIFQPFVQADGTLQRRFGGTGLGLAISKRLVDAMSGEIGVTSELGKGSTFWFSIPLKTEKADV